MPIRDQKFLPGSKVAEHLVPVALTTANSLTARSFFLFRPGYQFAVTRLGAGCRTKAGAVTINARILRGDSGLVSNAALAIDSDATKFQVGAFSYVLAGQVYAKAAATALTFSAANTIATASKWGVFAVQINAAGTVSTVPGATAMAYGTRAEALAALPAPSANNVVLGAIVIQTKAGAGWTANTDDMTDGSDVTTAEFLQASALFPALVVDPLAAALTPVGGQYVEATTKQRGAFFETVGSKTSLLVLTQTTDGTGALTDASVMLGIREHPLNGEASPGSLLRV